MTGPNNSSLSMPTISVSLNLAASLMALPKYLGVAVVKRRLADLIFAASKIVDNPASDFPAHR